ncbi:MAG: sodium:proton antiporter [Ruminococcaceae bacterium]|nr:sodium:proton antiporter [Oscillospiraceae bacterium]
MEMATLLGLSIALMAGLFMSRVVKPLKLPAVTGYLIAGILIGPYCLGRLGITGVGFTSVDEVTSLSILNDVALGFIAFAIGDEFRLEQLKHTGKQATIIGIFQAVATTLVVDGALIGLHFILGEERLPLSSAIILGAIASATAPAATLMVVRQYKAKGRLTNLLLPIVALDDAVGLIIFAVSFGVAKALVHGEFSLVSILVDPLAEIVFSLVLGAILGWFLSFSEKFFHSRSKRQAIVITAIFLAVALSKLKFSIGPVHIGFSPLLVCMMLGTIFCNVCDFSANLMEKTDRWTTPLFILFFVLSGAELEFSVFSDLSIIGIGVIYIIARSLGKYFGAGISAKVSKCEPHIQKYLGITLLPQAGVALGMSITAMSIGESGIIIRNIVLFGVLIYELFGPTLTKIALTKAGDISPKPETEKVPLPKGRV